ncbi:Protein Dok-7 [Plecturocebus cupreus]
MTEAALVEGQVKLRDGKKVGARRGGGGGRGHERRLTLPLSPQWKSRWLVLRKPSPVADCLLMLAYKDKSERAKGLRERSSLTLEDICGLEPGLPYEGLAHTLAIVCLSQAVMLGFDSHEAMCAWDARIRYALGEAWPPPLPPGLGPPPLPPGLAPTPPSLAPPLPPGLAPTPAPQPGPLPCCLLHDALSPHAPTVHRFHVTVAPGTKLESGPATLHLCNDVLVLARDIPPAVTGQWKLSDLRRYGAVPNGFIFEGGTRCGYCKYGCVGPLGSGDSGTPTSPRAAGIRPADPTCRLACWHFRTPRRGDGVFPHSVSEVLCPGSLSVER